MKLNDIVEANRFNDHTEVCPGCENHCRVRCFEFGNGHTYYSGNNCERVFANQKEIRQCGVNLFAEKYQLLFSPAVETPKSGKTIGIPRGLGIYENYPFWHTLFSLCGFRVVLSRPSSNRLYERGIRSIMADNICFPAKLMHGHVMDLTERKVDRIFYPWVVFEQKEDEHTKNSFNCPVVSGYSDVLRSSIDPEKNYGIPLDAPVVSFKEEKLLRKSLHDYLRPLGVDKRTIDHAVTQALDAQQRYLDTLERRGLEVLQKAEQEGRMVIMLAARPYHIDPLIQHKIADAIAAMGVDVITENAAAHAGQGVYGHLNALCQWAYPNRIFKAAYMVGKSDYTRLHIVELTSFGCGPDAFILDEVRGILRRFHKNLTVLKIDDVNNIGSLRLRVRSLVESVQGTGQPLHSPARLSDEPWTTKVFEQEDKQRTIIAPYFAEGYTEFIPTLFGMAGYRVEPLPMGCQADAEEGLRDANNDICYPATIVIGSILRALKSGKYDLQNTAVAITQTGGQCRASNYYSLIKNALVAAGFAGVPLISVATGKSLGNPQPGFEIPWRKIARPTLEAIYFADTMAKLYYPSAPREKTKGAARELYDAYIAAAQPLLVARDYRGLHQLVLDAVEDFTECIDTGKQVPQVGLVGEIFVKYNSFSNKSVVQWLIDHGVEVVPPALSGFFSTSMPNAHINRELHIKTQDTPQWVMDLGHTLVQHVAHTYDRLCEDFPFYRPFTDIFRISDLSRQVINPAADFGEGWFLPGEICDLAESGIRKVVSVQPFGCIANHIISKGIERRLKDRYPNLSLLFLDFDSGTSEANVYNRLHFLLTD